MGGMEWRTPAVVVARLVFALVFAMAVTFKLMDPAGTAAFIADAGFPAATFLTWCAIVFEVALVLALFTGAFFTEASLLAGLYVVFLAFAFHGPGRWAGNPAEFGFFVSHFPFFAGLMFAAAHGPGTVLALRHSLIKR